MDLFVYQNLTSLIHQRHEFITQTQFSVHQFHNPIHMHYQHTNNYNTHRTELYTLLTQHKQKQLASISNQEANQQQK